MLVAVQISFELNGHSFLDEQGQRAGMFLLIGMLLSFAFIRFSTRMIRAEVSWWPGNVTPGGLHIHHLVFGIVMMMIAGFLGFSLQPDSPWLEMLAAMFGIGVGLTLDEFALWLYLEDVYWAEEGRRSVDAVIFAAIIGGALLMGLTPISSADSSIVVSLLVVITLCLGAALKGKFWSTVIGSFIPAVSLIGAIRLARPASPWARKLYSDDKLVRAQEREAKHNKRWRRWQDRIGGAPSRPSPRVQRTKQGED